MHKIEDIIIEVYPLADEYNLLRMFYDNGIKVKKSYEFSNAIVEKFDIIFAASASMFSKDLYDVKKYIFTFTNNIFLENGCGEDFEFCSIDKINNKYKKNYKNVRMAIGNPVYDNLKRTTSNNNQILFIESGHYPYGSESRIELSKTILNICKEFPSYKLVIKPRFLPGDNMVHINKGHLYKYILKECNGNLPENLIMLTEHLDLEELINKSKTVISLCTSAYIEPIIADKGLIVLEGLKSEESRDIRYKIINDNYNRIRKSGCVVNYKDVCNYLPEGIKCNENYYKEKVFSTGNISDKIVEVIEYVYDVFLSKGKFPKIKMYTYNNFKAQIKEDRNINWEKIERNRARNAILVWIFAKFIREITIDLYIMDGKEQFLEELEKLFLEKNFCSKTRWEYYEKSLDLLRGLFIKNSSKLMNDKIDQAILLEAMFHKGKINEIINMKEKVLCKEYYLYIEGVYNFSNERYEDSIRCFEKYFNVVSNKDFEETLADDKNVKDDARCKLYLSYIKINDLHRIKINTIINENNKCLILLEMLKNRMFDKILSIDKKEIQSTEFYMYLKARCEFGMMKYENSIEYFKKYLDFVNTSFQNEKNDFNWKDYELSAYFYLAEAYKNNHKIKQALKYYNICLDKTDGEHVKAMENINLLAKEIE